MNKITGMVKEYQYRHSYQLYPCPMEYLHKEQQSQECQSTHVQPYTVSHLAVHESRSTSAEIGL